MQPLSSLNPQYPHSNIIEPVTPVRQVMNLQLRSWAHADLPERIPLMPVNTLIGPFVYFLRILELHVMRGDVSQQE